MNNKKIKLPAPKKEGNKSLEEIIYSRRTRREFKTNQIKTKELSQLLWAGQGITDPGMTKRAAPSAGATYPFELYSCVHDVENLSDGIYKYVPNQNELKNISDEDIKRELKSITFDQSFVSKAAVNIVLVADYRKTTDVYDDRGVRYVNIEAGHIAQNICLQSESLSLEAVLVGSFDDEKLTKLLNLKDKKPLYILSIGKIK